MRRVIWLLALVLVGAAVWVRVAPSDPVMWHVDPVTGDPADGAMRTGLRSARTTLVLPGAPGEVLARLDAVALASLRTQRLAGSPGEGRMTWITRSALWGFPDYTTAAATAVDGGTRVDLFARARFGGGDLGVSAARLRDWLARLGG